MGRLSWLLLCAVLVGCTTVGVENVERLNVGAKVVPLSLMGDTLAIRYIGTTVFQNGQRDLSVPSWQVDKRAESLVAAMITRGGKFTAEAADTTAARQSAGKLGEDYWTGKATLQDGATGFISFAKGAHADYILVIRPAKLGDPFFTSNQSLSGYGVGERTVFGSKRAVNYVTMEVVLLSATDGKEVARTFGFLSSPRNDGDWMEVDNLSPTEGNAASTKAAIESLLEVLLRKRLLELKMTR